jgi:hypothetical protein
MNCELFALSFAAASRYTHPYADAPAAQSPLA